MTRAYYVTYALDDTGAAIDTPTVDVYDAGTTNHIGQTLYAADAGATSKANPFTGGADGRVEFYLDSPAGVDIKISKAGLTPVTIGAIVNPPIVYGDTADLADIGSAEAAGSSTELPRADHVHNHPVYVTGDLHGEYLQEAAHTLAVHNALGITPAGHHASHEPGGSDEIIGGGGGGGGSGFSASFAYYVYKSGSTYNCVRTIDNTLIVTSAASFHTAANAASTALTQGGGILVQDNAHTTTGTVVLNNGARLFGSRTNTDGDTAWPLISAAGSLSTAVVRLASFNSGIFGVAIDGNTRSDNAVQVLTQAGWLQYLMVMGGTQRCIYFDPATSGGPARGRMSHIRAKGIGTQSVGVIEMNSSDHIVMDITCTGVGAGGNPLIINGQNGTYSSMHITGDAGSSDTLLLAGNNNQFSSVILDTVGSASTAGLLIRGNRNKFASLECMNVASGLTRPAIAIQPTAGNAARGNQVHGLTVTDGAQNQNWTGVLKFLTSGGAAPATLDNYRGTTILGAGDACNVISAGNFTNMSIPTNMDINFEFYSSSAGIGQYVRAV